MIAAHCESLCLGYQGRTVVCDVSFELRAGESLLLLGHNGSGKSTLLKTMFGRLAPISGRCMIAGCDPQRTSTAELVRLGVRYLAQGVRAFDLLPVGCSRRTLTKLYGFDPGDASRLGLEDDRVHQRVGALSVGQRRLEALAILSAGRPAVLLLDEPMAALDARLRTVVARWIRDTARDLGAAFVIAEHEFSELLPFVQNAIVVNGGMVTYQGPSSTLGDAVTLADAYL